MRLPRGRLVLVMESAAPEKSLEDTGHVLIRPRIPGDEAFIFGTWLQGHYEKSLFAKGQDWATYKALHHQVIERLLERGSTLVACASDFPTQIFGYLCHEGPGEVLHYVFVKGPFKRNGIAGQLMAEAGFTKTKPFVFTHLNNSDLVHQLRKKWPLGKYNPYLAWNE